MFFDSDSLKTRKLLYRQGEDRFFIDGKTVLFAEVSAFYRVLTEHYVNQFYQGTCLRVELWFMDGRTEEIYEVDSKHQDHYRLLHYLAAAIETFRRQQLEGIYRSGKEVGFDLQGNAKSISLKESDLLFDNARVEALRFSQWNGSTEIEFILPGRTVTIATTAISDSVLFVDLVRQVVPISVKPPSRRAVWLNRAFWLFVLCFGVNGWLDESALALWMDNPVVEVLSVVAKILLLLVIVLRPVFWLVGRVNNKVKTRERERLSLSQ